MISSAFRAIAMERRKRERNLAWAHVSPGVEESNSERAPGGGDIYLAWGVSPRYRQVKKERSPRGATDCGCSVSCSIFLRISVTVPLPAVSHRLNHKDTEGTESASEKIFRVAVGNPSRCWKARSTCHPAPYKKILCDLLCVSVPLW